MSLNCTKDNCDVCDNCPGDGHCFQQTNGGPYFRHRCNRQRQCVLFQCPRCKLDCPQWYLNCNNGFCTTCATKLYYVYKESTTYPVFMKKIAKIYNNSI